MAALHCSPKATLTTNQANMVRVAAILCIEVEVVLQGIKVGTNNTEDKSAQIMADIKSHLTRIMAPMATRMTSSIPLLTLRTLGAREE